MHPERTENENTRAALSRRLLLAFLATLLCYLVFLFFSPLYYSSDSLMAAIVVDGMFSSDNLSQFQHPILCAAVRLLLPLLPHVDVFTALIHLTVAIGLFSLVFFLSAPTLNKPFKTRRVDDFIILLILLLGVFFLSAGVNIWNNNYTITAGAFVFMGLCLTLPGSSSGGVNGARVAGLFLIAMGIMLRRESALLFLPFIILDLLVCVAEKPGAWKGAVKGGFPILLVFLVLMGSRAVVYRFEPYATASRYNAARTAIMDFPMEGTTDVDPVDYRAAIDYWTFADTENMNLEKLEQIAAAGARNAYPLTMQGFWAVLSKIKHDAFHTNLYMSVLVIATLILLLRNLLLCRAWRRAESALAVAGALLILGYFTFRGRAPMRVWEPVLFATVFALIRAARPIPRSSPQRGDGAGKRAPGWRGAANTVALLLIAVDLWFSAGQVMAYAKMNTVIRTTLTARVEADDSEYRDDALYIWPNWHGTIPRYYEQAGTLPPQKVIDHNIALGDWTYGQPYYTEFLSRIGAENPIQLLVDGEAFIMGNGIEEYLRRHYGPDIRLVPTDIIIDEKTAYRVERETQDGETDG